MAGYNEPQPAKDNWTRRLYRQYALGASPTMETIESVAVKLLANLSTALDGAELTLGRRIDGQEQDTGKIFASLHLTAKEKFALLLLQKTIEEM